MPTDLENNVGREYSSLSDIGVRGLLKRKRDFANSTSSQQTQESFNNDETDLQTSCPDSSINSNQTQKFLSSDEIDQQISDNSILRNFEEDKQSYQSKESFNKNETDSNISNINNTGQFEPIIILKSLGEMILKMRNSNKPDVKNTTEQMLELLEKVTPMIENITHSDRKNNTNNLDCEQKHDDPNNSIYSNKYECHPSDMINSCQSEENNLSLTTRERNTYQYSAVSNQTLYKENPNHYSCPSLAKTNSFSLQNRANNGKDSVTLGQYQTESNFLDSKDKDLYFTLRSQNDPFLDYTEEELSKFAVSVKLIGSEKDAKNLFLGHYEGFEAIRHYMKCKFNKQINKGNFKNTKNNILSEIVDKMRMGYYDGAPISEIVKKSTKNFGEGLSIYRSIMNSGEKIFCPDRKFSLPFYEKSEIELNDFEKKIYTSLWMKNKANIRKRDDFSNVFKTYIEDFEEEKLDSIIEYLVEKYIKSY